MIKPLRGFGLAGSALLTLLLTECAPPPPAIVVPPRPAPDETTIQQIKITAYHAGFIAGRRLQARRDSAQIAAAHATIPTPATTPPPAKPDCTPAPTPTPTPPITTLPNTIPAPVYTPLGPAVPLGPGN
jgi:hypothetical protein